jgi:hypothetical protein
MTTVDDTVYFDTEETAPAVPRTKASLDAAKIRELRNSPPFKSLKEKFRAVCARNDEPCWLCREPIDYKLTYPHPLSWSLDHKISVKERPDLLMDWENFAASHLDCNLRRGTDDPAIDLGKPSEDW